MFTPFVYIGLGMLLIGLFSGRFLAGRALRLLSPNEKVVLLD
jgi:hypothetical protein